MRLARELARADDSDCGHLWDALKALAPAEPNVDKVAATPLAAPSLCNIQDNFHFHNLKNSGNGAKR